MSLGETLTNTWDHIQGFLFPMLQEEVGLLTDKHRQIKDEFGGRTVRVRGHAEVFCHIMFGIIALTVDPLLRFVT
jgi:hypothetical protein